MKTPVRVLSVLFSTAVLTVLASGAAFADEPVGWPAGSDRSFLSILVLFGGGTVGLFIVVALFGLATARNNYVPPPPSTELEVAPGKDAAQH